jgi:hypothetical protein
MDATTTPTRMRGTLPRSLAIMQVGAASAPKLHHKSAAIAFFS